MLLVCWLTADHVPMFLGDWASSSVFPHLMFWPSGQRRSVYATGPLADRGLCLCDSGRLGRQFSVSSSHVLAQWSAAGVCMLLARWPTEDCVSVILGDWAASSVFPLSPTGPVVSVSVCILLVYWPAECLVFVLLGDWVASGVFPRTTYRPSGQRPVRMLLACWSTGLGGYVSEDE